VGLRTAAHFANHFAGADRHGRGRMRKLWLDPIRRQGVIVTHG
jgi:hypothetical protein